MDAQMDRRTNRKIRNIFFKGCKKVVVMKVGGTNVVFYYRWYKCLVLAIGGTYVDLIEGGTNVGRANVGRTINGGRKVAALSIWFNLERKRKKK